MAAITTADGTHLYVRDWGRGRPVVLIHGWPLNSDSWEYQAVPLAEAGYRVVSYDRRGFGRSDQPWNGYDYDTLADDLAAVMDGLDLDDATLVGFSMGGGEVARYMSRHGGRVSQVVFVSSVVPGMLKSDSNPDGITPDLLDQMQAGLRQDRPAFLTDFFKDFYGQSLVSGVSQPVLDWSRDMAMMASPRATLECVTAFGTTDFTGDVPHLKVPTLIVHGTGDKTVPIAATARRLANMLPEATLIEYGNAPHGLTATHADRLTDDLLAFLAQA
ncbi:alpha/beta hydrolase [uncultured Paracoccus sp.]|uniref:alpha/beta fold hydrolase n=1 Tax=uncultured Paracoccus sp. TaxID=189685 RepID=UPI0025DC1CC3|nr:alpha/beta hydrolase [uncultured Paracoccus sp.]